MPVRKLQILLHVLLLVLLFAALPPAFAQETQPGDACTVAGHFRTTGGVENPDGHMVFCDGSAWQPILGYSSAGGWVMFGSAGLAAAPLQVWGEAIIGSQGLDCTAPAEGALRYTSSSDLWEYCDGAAWGALAGGGTPGGADREIQFNSAGNFAADAGFVFTSTGRLGLGTATPQAFVDFDSTEAMLVPRGSTPERPGESAQPPGVNGMFRYNTQKKRFEGYQDGQWKDLVTGQAGAELAFVDLIDTDLTGLLDGQFVKYESAVGLWQPTDIAINDLSNVNTAPADGECLIYVNAAGEWQSGACGGGGLWTDSGAGYIEYSSALGGLRVAGVTGQPAPNIIGVTNLNDLGDVNAPTPADQEVLKYDNGTGKWISGTVAATPAGANTQVQFNDNGAFGASANFTYNGTTLSLAGRGEIDVNASNWNVLDIRNTASDGWSSIDFRDSGDAFKFAAGYANSGASVFPGTSYLNSISALVFGMGNAEKMRLTPTGRLGIGTPAPGAALDVAGIMRAIDDGAACTAATRGAIRFNGAGAAMELCDGSAWGAIATGVTVFTGLTDTPANYTGAANKIVAVNGAGDALVFTDEADPTIGTLTNTKWCTTDGTTVNCATDAPVLTETDPQVSAVTNGQWCRGNGSAVTCDQGPPVTSETDPEVGTLTASKWCTTDGSAVNCTTDAPAFGAIDDLSDAIYDGSSLFLGAGAGATDDGTANANVATGFNALNANTSGAWNTAFGYQALMSNTTGNGNAAVGLNALVLNTTGTWNVAHGYNALNANTVGSNNTAIGLNALQNNVAKSKSTALGFEAMRYADDTTTAGDAYNTAIGYQALYGSTNPTNNTGTGNTAIGALAGDAVTSGTNNTFVGREAGSVLTTGGENVMVGYNAGLDTTTGNLNSYFGGGAGRRNVDGHGNTGVGHAALINFVGGGNNTAIGSDALFGVIGSSNGQRNTAVGANAGNSITTGSDNILIGYDVDVPDPAISNFINIGDVIYGSGGNVGIGTTSPEAKLDVNGTVKAPEADTGFVAHSSVTNGSTTIDFTTLEGALWRVVLVRSLCCSGPSLASMYMVMVNDWGTGCVHWSLGGAGDVGWGGGGNDGDVNWDDANCAVSTSGSHVRAYYQRIDNPGAPAN